MTEIAVAARPTSDRRPAAGPWVLAAAVPAQSVDVRAAFEARARTIVETEPDRHLLVATCHRVELYGVGPRPDDDDAVVALDGDAAVRRLMRLAAGLESAVVGESQVLGQVRDALATARGHRRLDGRLVRLAETAIAIGRRARRTGVPVGHGLAGRALDRLEAMVGPVRGRTIVIAGTGTMGRALIRAAAGRGAAIVVVGRDARRAADRARAVGGTGLDLDAGAAAAEQADGILVALGGPWTALARARRLPPIVDLSAPAAVPATARRRADGRFAGVDDLAGRSLDGTPSAGIGPAGRRETAYVARAADLAESATASYLAWLAGRDAVPQLRTIRDRAEARREREVARLLRRLPELGPRERAQVEAATRRLVAALLHEPTARLRVDVDGSGALAARRLFDA